MSNFFDYLLIIGFLFISYRYFTQLAIQHLKIIAGLFIARNVLMLIYDLTLSGIAIQAAGLTLLVSIALFIYYLMRYSVQDAFKLFNLLGVITLLFKIVVIYFYFDMIYTISYILIIPLLIFGFYTFSVKHQDFPEVKIITLFGIEVLIQSVNFFSYSGWVTF